MTPDEAKALLPQVLEHLDAARDDAVRLVRESSEDLVRLVSDRYLAGCDEFAGDWVARSDQWCEDEAREELADLVTYLAFRRIKRAG